MLSMFNIFYKILQLPSGTRSVSYEASGIGHVLLQLAYQFYLNDVNTFKNFHIQVETRSLNIIEKEIQICFEYLSDQRNAGTTNMVIMEINLPSGYRSQAEDSYDLMENDLIQRIASKNDQSTVILYFDNLVPKVQHCLSVEAEQTHEIEKLKPAAILMYDYYNMSRHDTVFYGFK